MIRLTTEAVTLFYHDVGESDRAIAFYTSRAGRLSAFANGARKLKNRFGGSLEPFKKVELSLYKRKQQDPWKVGEAVIKESFAGVSANIAKLMAASYVCNLVVAFTAENDPEAAIFGLLLDFMILLEKRGDINLLARLFELKLLDLSGHKLQLARCSNCAKSSASLLISVSSGGMVCEKCATGFYDTRRVTRGTMSLIRAVQDGETRLLGRFKASQVIVEELKLIGSEHTTYITSKEIVLPDIVV